MDNGIQHIGELSKDGVFMYNTLSGKFTYMNDPFAMIFDTSKDQLMEKPGLILMLMVTEDAFYLRQRYAELVKEGSVSRNEFRIHFANNIKHLSCDAYLLNDNLVGGFVKDVTCEKQHEDYIIDYGAKKDTLLDMITHNLTGPLHLSHDILRWMQRTYTDNSKEDLSTQLKMIQANTQECIDIVNDFLRQEHLESERIFVRKTRFDLLDRIMTTLEKIIATNKNKKFRVITDLAHLDINADSVKFFQVIHNLISNAIKFTPDGGQIDIIVEEHPRTFIIRVKDNGIGIPAHLHSQLFDRYTASKRDGLNNEPSSGIGLHIVKVLVGLMEGKVWFESGEYKGSTFSIELPKD
jgi:two-component system, OmpR family, sensor histidine kinase VicK